MVKIYKKYNVRLVLKRNSFIRLVYWCQCNGMKNFSNVKNIVIGMNEMDGVRVGEWVLLSFPPRVYMCIVDDNHTGVGLVLCGGYRCRTI